MITNRLQIQEYYTKLTDELVIEMRKYEAKDYRASHAKLIFLTLSSLKPIAQGMHAPEEVKMIDKLLAKFQEEIKKEDSMKPPEPSKLAEFLNETEEEDGYDTE